MAAAAAAPKPEDRLAFADELAQVRTKDVDGEYKKELDELEVEYQFILLRSLTLFHKEMQRNSLPEKLHEIKEKLTDTVGKFDFQTNLPNTNWDWNSIICKQCRKTSLKPMPATNELCCEICGVLETLDGAYFNDEELHKCGDDFNDLAMISRRSVDCLPVDNFLGFKRAVRDPFPLGGDGSLLFFAHKNFVR